MFCCRTYFITGPRKVYPNQVVQLSVAVIKLYHSHMNVRAIIKKDDKEEIASAKQVYDRPAVLLFQMKVSSYFRLYNLFLWTPLKLLSFIIYLYVLTLSIFILISIFHDIHTCINTFHNLFLSDIFIIYIPGTCILTLS